MSQYLIALCSFPDVKSHISVQIFSNESFIPSEIILKDDSNILIQNIPLKLHDAKENIYITDKVLPPEGLFKIVVSNNKYLLQIK